MNVAKKKRTNRWSPAVMRVYQKYPAAFNTSQWDRIVTLANAGRVDDAMAIAAEHQTTSKSHRAQNIIARRIRIQRVALFKLQREHVAKINDSFEIAAQRVANRMIHLPNTISSIAPMREKTHEVIVDLRRSLLKIITDLIWQSILMGVHHMGEAIKPIMRDNAESFKEELHDVELIEERLTLGMSKKLARKTDGTVDLNSAKWEKIVDDLYASLVKENLTGMTLSERIFDLTSAAEQNIKRTLASEIAKGTSSRDIADQIQKYIFTNGVDEDYQSGPGIYKSPLKNALRVARTETNRAYTQASAAWAENKPWVKGLRVTLSPAHEVEDDCDDVVNDQPDDGYPPDEFGDYVPVHPHCMCYPTYVIDEKYLTGDVNPDGTPDTGEED